SLSDGKCDAGTLAGGPTKALAPGESATYTCSHVLVAADEQAGSYTNNATVTATPPAGQGSPITQTSNTVVVSVTTSPQPAFTIEKTQKIEGSSGSFTTSPLSGKV